MVVHLPYAAKAIDVTDTDSERSVIVEDRLGLLVIKLGAGGDNLRRIIEPAADLQSPGYFFVRYVQHDDRSDIALMLRQLFDEPLGLFEYARIAIEDEMDDIFGAADCFADQTVDEIIINHFAFRHMLIGCGILGVTQQLTG